MTAVQGVRNASDFATFQHHLHRERGHVTIAGNHRYDP